MKNDISLTFTNLTDDEAHYLLGALAKFRSENTAPRTAAEMNQHYGATPVSAPQALSEYDAARQHVEQHHASEVTASAAHAPQIPAPAMSSAIEVDVHGVPWHPEYHSSGKSKTQKGVWALRKGVDKAAAEAYIARHSRASASVAQPQAAALAMPVNTPEPQTQAIPTTRVPTHIVPDYGTWYQAFDAAYKAGRMNTEADLVRLCQTGGIKDTAEFAQNDQARAATYPMLLQLGHPQAA